MSLKMRKLEVVINNQFYHLGPVYIVHLIGSKVSFSVTMIILNHENFLLYRLCFSFGKLKKKNPSLSQAPMFSWPRLRDADPLLKCEMASTGEVNV